ncbi:unnamed protein product [Caenorhabditis auriculariae]|uniref:Pep3/Vps18 beta-propeller domain-containing protein n=1 Tax=Caenorhabditis auriculariae TaxID=2777116 RepID=A0A8S1H8L9_9PELO|nr:unnamed protein product [Caenorhabditis auriculariae]
MLANNSNSQNGIFVRSTLDFKKDLKVHRLVSLGHFLVKNGEMLAAISDKIVLHQSVSTSDRQTELSLPLLQGDAIAHVHLSLSGFHAIVSTKNGQNFYIHMKTNSVHHLKKLNKVISAVGWNPECLKDTETGPILLGTQQGAVLEMSLSSSGMVHFLKEHTPSLSFGQSGQNSVAPITDIQLFAVNFDDPHANKWILIISQPTRISCLSASIDPAPVRPSGFTSSASLQAGLLMPEAPQTVFHPFFNSKDVQFNCLYATTTDAASKGKLQPKSCLVFHPQTSEPSRFAWLTSEGVITGSVNVYAEKIQDVLVEQHNIEHRLIEGRIEAAVGISLTEYHLTLAYSSRLLDVWPNDLGSAQGLTSDPSSEFLWLHTSTVCMKYRPNDEARYVWRVFLDRGEYSKALQIARTRLNVEPEAHEMVLRKQADFYIDEKNFTAAAEILAQSNEPFESIVLKFLSIQENRKMGLKTLLDKKLERMNRPEDRMKRDALVIWLLEVQLTELAELRRCKDKEAEVRDVVDHVQRFLMRKNVFDAVQTNLQAVYRMMVSHADFDLQLFVANAVKDVRTIVNILMLREQYNSVLEVLKTQSNMDFTYEMAPLLIEHIPKQLFLFLLQNERVRPLKILPTLSLCLKTDVMAIPAMKYIDWAITRANCNDKRLHNLLIQMIAKFRPNSLLEYFTKCGTQRNNIPYDLEFAMRTCEQQHIEECVVYLFCVAEMFFEAVEKALKISVDLAKRCAKMMDMNEEDLFDIPISTEPRFSREYRKRIWLMIANHMIASGVEATECIGLLRESKEALSIQDILPLFPEFTKIDDFKDALCACLREHSVKIMDLQQAMKDATQIAAEIREKSDKLKNRVVVVKPGELCSSCARSLTAAPFFAHSCRHFFHRECLEIAMKPFLDANAAKSLEDLIVKEKRLFVQMEHILKVGRKSDAADVEAQFEQVEREIGKILGSDCPFCGTVAISLIDKPFFEDEEYELDENSWIV